MKKTNRLASLFLALLLAFSLMAVTASACDSKDSHVHTEACEDEGIMPLYPMKGPPCPYCGYEMYECKILNLSAARGSIRFPCCWRSSCS